MRDLGLLGILSFTGEGPTDKEVVSVIEDPTPQVLDQPQADGRQQSLGEGPFMLSKTLPAVPAKLVVRKVVRGVSRQGRLPQEAERRRMPTGDSGMSGLPQERRREVPAILSWLHCFSMYTVIVSLK